MKFNFYYWFFGVTSNHIYICIQKKNKDAQVLGTENNPL